MLYAMFAMIMLTFTVGMIAFVVRVRSVRSGDVRPKAYLLALSEDLPQIVTKTTRNLNNQFEFPVHFLVVCTLYLVFDLESALTIGLAWAFVAMRAAHAYIHITYNHLLHRLIAFWLGIFVLMWLWINLVIQY